MGQELSLLGRHEQPLRRLVAFTGVARTDDARYVSLVNPRILVPPPLDEALIGEIDEAVIVRFGVPEVTVVIGERLPFSLALWIQVEHAATSREYSRERRIPMEPIGNYVLCQVPLPEEEPAEPPAWQELGLPIETRAGFPVYHTSSPLCIRYEGYTRGQRSTTTNDVLLTSADGEVLLTHAYLEYPSRVVPRRVGIAVRAVPLIRRFLADHIEFQRRCISLLVAVRGPVHAIFLDRDDILGNRGGDCVEELVVFVFVGGTREGAENWDSAIGRNASVAFRAHPVTCEYFPGVFPDIYDEIVGACGEPHVPEHIEGLREWRPTWGPLTEKRV